MTAEIVVPTLGESVTEATVAQWLKKVGDKVSVDDPLVELETDKVTMEVNAKSAGVLAEIKVQSGENVEVGAVLGAIGAEVVNAAATPAPVATQVAAQPVSNSNSEVQSAPAARKTAADNNVELASITGTGKDGRVMKGDVLDALAGGLAATSAVTNPAPASTPSPAVATGGGFRPNADREERVRMTRLRQRVAERLKEAQNTAAMLTTFNEVDMGHVMALRKEYKAAFEKKHGIKLGFMSFFVKAAVQALKDFPAVNAEIDGTDVVYKDYYDISVAVSTPTGLVVPVLRDADQKSFAEIEKSIVDLGTRARDGKLSMDDLTGGTFTITNGGVFGSLMSTPILNPPQSGIMGMHKIQQRPMAINGEVVIRPMMYLAMSYDHRIVDGKEAVSFLVRIKDAIEDPQRLLLGV